MAGLDNCPTCGRRITDFDPAGCESPLGQRYCLVHVPDDVKRECAAELDLGAWPAEVVADFDAQHLSISQADLAALLDEDEREHDGGPVGTARYTIR